MNISVITFLVSTLFTLYSSDTVNTNTNTSATGLKDSTANELQSNIAFDLADLTHTVQNGFGNIDIEAFRVLDNDKIIAESDASKYNQLR
jgi:hypothetical protein